MRSKIVVNEKEYLVDIIEGEEELLEIEPCKDYHYTKVFVSENGEVVCEFFMDIPKELSSTMKATITENLGAIMLTMMEQDMVTRSEIKSHDLNVGNPEPPPKHCAPVRIDVKFSMPHPPITGVNALRWEFWLSSGRIRKDYTQTCDFLLCVGLRPDGLLEFFMIPSDLDEVKSLKKHLAIPVSWKGSKYACYHYNLNLSGQA